MQDTHAPNTDPLPTSTASCERSGRKPARWTPYGSRSAPPVARRHSYPLKAPDYSLPLSPRPTPESGPSTGHKSHATSVEELPESVQIGEKELDESHEKKTDAANSKNSKKYEYTDDFIG